MTTQDVAKTLSPATAQLFEPVCGDCGYSLKGLPEEGRCPECGAAYSPDVLVLWGDEEIDLRKVEDGAYFLTIRQNLSIPVQMNVACPDDAVETLRLRIEGIVK